MKSHEPLALNSATGKSVLAMIRDGSYAHPGEEEAIELVFSGVSPQSDRQILDLGCGLGGTAHYIRDRGWGQVVGVDIDDGSVEAASEAFPESTFLCADAHDLHLFGDGQFDLVVLFTAFYAFEDQLATLHEMSRVLKRGGVLLLFDYAAVDADFSGKAKEFIASRAHSWKPIRPDQIGFMLRTAGLHLQNYLDLSDRFEQWYVALLERIEAKKGAIGRQFGTFWFAHVEKTYTEILTLIRKGILGGALVCAKKP